MKSIKSLPILCLCAISFSLVGCNTQSGPKSSSLKPMKIYDWYHDSKIPTASTTFTLEEFENPTFKVSNALAITHEGSDLKIEDVNAIYAYDINKDGYRDLCISTSTKTSPYADYCLIYDVKNNKQLFYIVDTTVNKYNDYHFSLEKDKLLLTKDSCDKSAVVEKTYSRGLMDYSKEKGVYTMWENMYDFNTCDISLSFGDIDNNKVDMKVDGNVNVVDIDMNAMYCFTVDYYSKDFTNINNLDVRPHMFSLANRDRYDDNIKIVKTDDLKGTYKTYFYFTKAASANYEFQVSGHSELFKFNIAKKEDRSVNALFGKKETDLNSVTSITYEEDQTGIYQEGALRRIYNYTGKDIARDFLKAAAFPVGNVELAAQDFLQKRVTYTYPDKSYSIDIYSNGYAKYNDKYYAVLGNIEGNENLALGSLKFAFSYGVTSGEIENLTTGQKTTFEGLDKIITTAEYSPNTYHYDSKPQYQYKLTVGENYFYLIDANRFVTSVRAPNLHTIVSDFNFASVFAQ